MRIPALGALAFLIGIASFLDAQSITVRYHTPGLRISEDDYSASFNGLQVTSSEHRAIHSSNDNSVTDHIWTSDISLLDVASAQVYLENPYNIFIPCKGGAGCVQFVDRCSGCIDYTENRSTVDSIGIQCDTREECGNFINALRAASTRATGAGPAQNGSVPVSAPENTAIREERAAERERQRAQAEREAKAHQIQSEACKILIEAAALAGQSVDLGGDNACSQDINAQLGPDSTYVTVGGPAPRGVRSQDPVLDGSTIPTAVDFRQPGNALDQLTSSLLQPSGPTGGAQGQTSGQDSNSGGALNQLTQDIATSNHPDPPLSPAPDPAAGANPSSPSALSQLTSQITTVIKEKGPEIIYDKAGEKLADGVYQDSSKSGVATLLQQALSGPSSAGEPGIIREKASELFADKLFDKMDELRHQLTTDQHKVDETPYGQQLRDLLWSMDPANLRKGIYTYPRDILEKLNNLLDTVLGLEKNEQ